MSITAKAILRFGRLHLPNLDTVTLDLPKVSRQTGTELSGFLGFAMLRLLETKLDYRDGLVGFEYDPKRTRHREAVADPGISLTQNWQ